LLHALREIRDIKRLFPDRFGVVIDLGSASTGRRATRLAPKDAPEELE
jgi:hypothetical protein